MNGLNYHHMSPTVKYPILKTAMSRWDSDPYSTYQKHMGMSIHIILYTEHEPF